MIINSDTFWPNLPIFWKKFANKDSKIRFKINCHSPSIEKRGKISFNSYIWEHVRFGQKMSLFIIITIGKYADSVLLSSSY